MDTAGITAAVMVARSVPGVRVSNVDLANVAAAEPDRLIGVASVDPIELGAEKVVAEATRAVNFDTGFYAEPLKANDERLMPLYELCQTLEVPAFHVRLTTPDLVSNDPFAVDVVPAARDSLLPRLLSACCRHRDGGVPP